MGADKGKSIATTMAPATMTHPSATLLDLARSTFSRITILQSNRGSGRSGYGRTPKGEPRNAA
eukprot:12900632-Ditylum_brightwellii.AAC.1